MASGATGSPPVAAVEGELVLVEVHPDAGAIGDPELEVAELEGLDGDGVLEQQMPEELAPLVDARDRGEGLRIGCGADGGLEHAAAIEPDTRGFGDSRDLPRVGDPAGLCELEREDVR